MKHFLHSISLFSFLFVCVQFTSAQTPVLVSDLNPGTADAFDEFNFQGVALGGKMLLPADNGQTGQELYVLENDQLTLLKDINPGTASSSPTRFTVFQDKAYFVADDGVTGKELWVSDGTEAGTHLVIDLNNSPNASDPKGLTVGNDGRLYFSSTGKCFSTDGTSAGTTALSGPTGVNFEPDYSSTGNKITPYGNAVAFIAIVDKDALIWTVSGTTATKVGQIATGSYYSYVYGINSVEKGLVFGIDNSIDALHNGLYVYDATANTTTRLQGTIPYRLASFNHNVAVFLTNNSYYATNGSSAGTFFLSSDVPSYTQGSPMPYAVVNGKMILEGATSGFKIDMLVTDGTPAGTSLLKSVDESFLGFPIITSGNDAFFASGTSNGFNAHLWQSNGNTAGTKNLYTYTTGSPIKSVVPVVVQGNYLYYISNLGNIGRELYKIKFTPSVATFSPSGLAVKPYRLLYSGLQQARIESAEPGEALQIEYFDNLGRLIISDRTVLSGDLFFLPLQSAPAYLRVRGRSGVQSFVVLR